MDLRAFLLNNASLHSRPRRRRHSIADVRFLHTLHDIPEKPEEEDTGERRRSTGSYEKGERPRAESEPPGNSTEYSNGENVESTEKANDSRVCPPVEHDIDKSPRYKRGLSFEDGEQLKEAVSTYVLSYTDDAGNVCSADDVSPTTTGSSSPQESSQGTSDEELAMSEILRKVDAPMVPQRSRRGSVIDPEVVERITSLTPIVESSRSSSIASVSTNLNATADDSDYYGESEMSSRRSSTKNADAKEDMLGKILGSPRLTRRGSLSDVLRSLSPQFQTTSDLGRQAGTVRTNEKLGSRSPSSPMNLDNGKTERHEIPIVQAQAKNENQPKQENESVLGKIMNSPNLLKRRGSLGDVLRTLSPHPVSSPSKVFDTEKISKTKVEKGGYDDGPNMDKDGLLGRIMRSPSLTRRGSIGNILNTLSPNPTRKCPSPSPLTIKCDTDGAPSGKTSPVCPHGPKPKDVEVSPSGSRPKGLLAIVQQHVINHSQAMQRKRRNSIASAEPHTGTLELSLRESLDIDEWETKNDSVSNCKSPVLKKTTPVKDSSSNKTNGNSKNNDKNKNNNKTVNGKNCYPEDDAHNAVSNHQTQDKAKGSSPSDNSKSKEKSHTSVKQNLTSSTPRKLVSSESMDVPREQLEQDMLLVKSPQRKISAPLPPRSVDPPQRKSSVNVIKRSPITFVISNDKSGRTEENGNASEYQSPSGVSFANSRFLPLSEQEADDYSRIKKAESSKPCAMVKSIITMSSRVTVYGGSGTGSSSGVVRKLGVAVKQPPLSDSLPTEERFAALSERYASLKAKLGASENKQKDQDSSPKLDEQRGDSPNTENKLTQSKCWTTVESIPVQAYGEQVFDKRVDLVETEPENTLAFDDGGKQVTTIEECGMNRVAITSGDDSDVTWNKKEVIETISKMNDFKKGLNIDANNNNSPSIVKTPVEKNGMQTSSSMPHDKTTLDLRPESPAQKSRTSVVAKLMNRKMGPRRKQSIVPRAAKRQSRVYKENGIEDTGIPRSAAQFEKIRALVENTVLRAPVRQEVRGNY